MYSLIFIIISAISKAISDTLSHHYKNSIFYKKGDFWDINKQGKFLRFTKYPFDGWHIFNSIMIISFITGFVFYEQTFNPVLEIFIGGIVFNLTFNLFYNKILKK